MDPDSMSMVDHLGEVRKRLFRVLLVTAAALIAGFLLARPVLDYFRHAEPAAGMEWNAFTPWDGIKVCLQLALIFSLVVSGPFALYQVWCFFKPGLKETERKATVRYIPYAFLLFLAGLGFAYFVVFPLAFEFTSGFNRSIELSETYGIAQYFSFMFNILLPLSLLFELPVCVLFLTRIGLLNPVRLRKMRRYAYMALLAASTFITPPDVISVLVVAVPMLLIYEASVLLSGRIYRKLRSGG